MQFVDKIRHRRGQESSAYGCGNAVHLNVVGLMSIHHRGVHGDGDDGNPAESAGIRGIPTGVGMNVAGIPRGWM